jgi:hypothetical protein
VLYDDQIVVCQQEVVTRGALDPNIVVQRWTKVPEGYIYSPYLQPVKNIPNTPVTTIPDGKPGFWAEVTVPYADMRLDGPAISPHIKYLVENNFPIRLYYSQVVWIDQVAAGEGGVVWYRFNENGGRPAGLTGGGYGDILWGEGSAFRVLTAEDVAPIHPDVDPAIKKVVVDSTSERQTLACFEGAEEVYFCRVSTGMRLDVYGNPVTEYLTPGEHTTWRKAISIHMSGGDGPGDTPAVSWTTLFSGEVMRSCCVSTTTGVPRSHGCVNCLPEDAKWVFAGRIRSTRSTRVMWRWRFTSTHVIVQQMRLTWKTGITFGLAF